MTDVDEDTPIHANLIRDVSPIRAYRPPSYGYRYDEPAKLREDARWLLEHNPDTVELVAKLLLDLRRVSGLHETAVERSIGEHRELRDENDRLRYELAQLREVVRAFRRATRYVRLGRS